MIEALLERRADAGTRAVALLARTAELTAMVESNRLMLAEHRRQAAQLRRALAAAGVTRSSVVVTGSIEGREVAATWYRSGRIVGDPELLSRAAMLVTMGERWDAADSGVETSPATITASLEGPSIAVALTLMRACTTIHSVTIPDGS
jgi:hypothetical protein